MRSSIQRHENISYIFMGSKKHLISYMFNDPNKPFYKSAKSFPLGKIARRELLDFINSKFEKTGKELSEGLAEEIIETCECHPYYVQYLCHILWERTRDKIKPVDGKDFSGSLELLLERESPTYEATWDLLTVKQRQVLTALARAVQGEKLFSMIFLRKHGLGSASSVQRIIHSLTKKDLVDKEGDSYGIIDVFFKKWLLKLKD